MYAGASGHNLLAGKPKNIVTGNGITRAYAHTTKIDIYDPPTKKFLYELPNTPIDFMPNLNIVLLGAKSFLSKFVLTIDYPKKVFSIKFPSTSDE
ncbi:MAG: hypothetical protein HQK89_04755 [Nitrospirae bacterium]|nr:hypothetical protein [Nitrospirota bacterium]